MSNFAGLKPKYDKLPTAYKNIFWDKTTEINPETGKLYAKDNALDIVWRLYKNESR